MTIDQVIDAIFAREGTRYGDPTTHPPIDQPTAAGGITLPVLGDYVRRTGAALEVSVATLQALTVETARPIVAWQLQQVATSGGFDRIDFEPLRWFMVDFAYNSGAGLAIRWLQRVLGVVRTSELDPVTIAALKYPDLARVPIFIHQSAIAARLQMVDSAVDRHAIAKTYEDGLERRVEAFSLLEVP